MSNRWSVFFLMSKNIDMRNATTMPANARYDARNISMSKNETVICVSSNMMATYGMTFDCCMSICSKLISLSLIGCHV